MNDGGRERNERERDREENERHRREAAQCENFTYARALDGRFEYTNTYNEDAFDRHVYAIYPNCIRRIARVGAWLECAFSAREREAERERGR